MTAEEKWLETLEGQIQLRGVRQILEDMSGILDNWSGETEDSQVALEYEQSSAILMGVQEHLPWDS
jgi:hypothetical protein